MKDGSPIVVLDPADKFEGQPDSHMEVKDIELVISGEPIHFQIGIRDQEATLLDIIPVARSLSSQIVQIAHKRVLKAGLTIPCHRGCSACCFHLVPLAIPEAVYLAEDVMGMSSEVHAQAERRCWEIANQVESSFPDFLAKNTIRNLRDVHKIGSWFRELNIPCAFLVDHECSIYEARPGTCREWSVTGTALACLAGSVLNSSVLNTTGGIDSCPCKPYRKTPAQPGRDRTTLSHVQMPQ